MAEIVKEIKPPRGAILTLEKLIQRTSNGGVVYAVWVLNNQPETHKITAVRSLGLQEGAYAVRVGDRLEERFGRTPCMMIQYVDEDDPDLPEQHPIALSALNIDGPVYRTCFAFSLQEQAEAYVATFRKPEKKVEPAPSSTSAMERLRELEGVVPDSLRHYAEMDTQFTRILMEKKLEIIQRVEREEKERQERKSFYLKKIYNKGWG